jgi:DNA polymerase-3 subunit delta
VPSVTLILGDEELLVARAVQRAVQAAQASVAGPGESAGEPLAVHDVDAADLVPAELAELTSPSLFGEARAVVVRAAQDASKDVAGALLSLAENGDDDVVLIVVHAGGAKGKALVEGLRGAGARVVEAPRMKTVRDREQFVADEVREAGGTIDRAAAADLVAAIGSDLRELATACPVLVSAALAANLRTIGLVASAGRGSPEALAGPLGMPPWKIRRAQVWVKRWQPTALAEAVRAVADADADIKGEGADAAYAAERAVVTVAGCAAG